MHGKSESGLTRRSFLKTTAFVAGSAALSGSVLSGCTTVAEKPSTNEVVERTAIGGCAHMGCGACQGIIKIRDEKVVGIDTWPENPTGKRPCLRGRVHWQRLYSNERIKYPMKRVGQRLEDKWEQISWDEAIATICDTFKGYFDQYGPTSVAKYGGGAAGGGYINSSLVTRLTNLVGWTDISATSDLAMAKGLNKVFGPAYNTWATPPFEMENAKHSKAIISWSGNISVAQTYEWRHVMDAKEGGTKLVTVDPLFTVTAQKSDLWIRPRPGTDTILQFGLMRHIIDSGLENKDFLLNHTVAPVLVRADTLRFLRMSDLGIEPTAGPVDPMTGQPTVTDPPAVWDTAGNIAVALDTIKEPAMEGTFTANGISIKTAYSMLLDLLAEWPLDKVSEMTTVPVEDIIALAEISADIPVYHFTGYGSQSYNNGVQTGHALATLGAVTGNMGMRGAGVSNGWHAPIFNIAYTAPTGTYAPSIPALAWFDVMTTGKYMGQDWPIKAIFLWGGGLIGGTVDTNRVMKEIIDKAEFIVCADVVFSDQARVADLVLPVCHNYEYEEIMAPGTFTIFNEKVVEPAFESKPDGEIARLIGEGLGYGEHFANTNEEFLRIALDSDSMREAGVTYDVVVSQLAYRHRPLDYVPSTTFPTPSGRMEFYVDAPFARADFGQEWNPSDEHLPRWFPPSEAWPEHEIMKEYPLIFMSERPRNRMHSLDYEATIINELEPEPIIRMNPRDAANRSIQENDYVEVVNTRGHAVARARLSSACMPGMVIYPKGWQMNQFKAGCWGELHNSEFDPVGVNNSYYDSVCEVKKWNEEA
jgi:molybdopterin-containing oxidoreductase family molybdopterin binding subunit